MNRFDWSPTIELEPGVTYIPAAVEDDGRPQMLNCRCRTVPLFKEDIEGEIIRSTRLPASKNSLSIEVKVTELHYVGHQPTPSITSFVLINPWDIESL